ncbi:MAG: hypothetical protein V4568_09530 [Pseudomonadota bacterium]
MIFGINKLAIASVKARFGIWDAFSSHEESLFQRDEAARQESLDRLNDQREAKCEPTFVDGEWTQ